MNRNIILTLSAMALLVGAYYAITFKDSKDNNTYLSEDRDFAVDDISKLSAFTITKKGRSPIKLSKNTKGDWILNDSVKANQLTVAAALAVFQKARIKFIPKKNAIAHVMKGIESQGIKIEYLDELGAVTKTYFIGSGTGKGDATYFLMLGAGQPYAMEMAGFDGLLRSRFDHLYEDWRSLEIFDFSTDDLNEISIEYPKDREHSFVISKTKNGFEVSPKFPTTTIINKRVNQSILDAYISNYKSLYAEGFENRNERKNDIVKQIPFVTINLTLSDNSVKSFHFHPVLTGIDPNLNPTAFKEASKINRYFTECTGGDLVLTQQYVVGKYFVSYSSFFDN